MSTGVNRKKREKDEKLQIVISRPIGIFYSFSSLSFMRTPAVAVVKYLPK
jgi:hypothetical protein